MSETFRPIDEIQSGDEVQLADGTWVTVDDIWPAAGRVFIVTGQSWTSGSVGAEIMSRRSVGADT